VVFRWFATCGGVLILFCSCTKKEDTPEPGPVPKTAVSKDAEASPTEVFQRERLKPSQVDKAITQKKVEDPSDGVVYRGPGRNAIGQASQAYQAQDFERALAILVRLLEVEPGQPVARAMAGEISETTGAFADAKDHFERSLKGLAEYPQNRERMNLQYQIGALYFHAGLSSEAIIPLQEALKHPAARGHEGRLNMMLSLSLEQTGQLEMAQGILRSLSVSGRDSKLRERALDRLKGLSKKSRQALEEAWGLYHKGQYEQARQIVESVSSTGPHRRFLTASLDLATKRPAEAQKELSALLFEVPEWQAVYRALRKSQLALPSKHLQYMDVVRSIQNGRKYIQTGRIQEHYDELLAALKAYPWVPLAYDQLAVAAHTLRQIDVANQYREIRRSMHQVMMSFEGDARTLERAFEVLHVGEEEAFMKGIGYTRTQRTIEYGKDGTPFHKVEGEKPGANRTRIFYFNVGRIEPAQNSGQ